MPKLFEIVVGSRAVLKTRLGACVIALGLAAGGLSGCAHEVSPVVSPQSPVSPPRAVEETEESYWWHARFQMIWPDGEVIPDFSTDLIIANEIIYPVVQEYGAAIQLWRFHRRAARDRAGHQFSFIFYSSAAVADDVFSSIQQKSLLDDLSEQGVLVELKLGDAKVPGSGDIAAASDSNWNPSIQRSWPYFIMGVSVMFMDLLKQEIDQQELDATKTLPERLDYYAVVNDRLSAMWRTQGRHAFIHHISGIFGYEPIDMRF